MSQSRGMLREWSKRVTHQQLEKKLCKAGIIRHLLLYELMIYFDQAVIEERQIKTVLVSLTLLNEVRFMLMS